MEDRRRRTFPRPHHETADAIGPSLTPHTAPTSRTASASPSAPATNVFFYSQRSGSSKPMLHRRSSDGPRMPPKLSSDETALPTATMRSSFRPSAVHDEEIHTHSSSPWAVALRGRTVPPPSRASPEPDDAMRARLHEVKHLFLCCRDLLSIHHIQYLAWMPNLEQLNLHMNLIKHVEGLSSLTSLVSLDLSANEIHTLDADAFTGLHRLRHLNLSSNFIRQLPNGLFTPLRCLERLSLGFNELVNIDGLADVPSDAPLTSVDLCGNQIRTLTEVARALVPHTHTMQELRLEVPKVSTLLASQDTADDPLLAVIASVQRPPHLFTRENPCCAHTLLYHKPGALTPATAKDNQRPVSASAARGKHVRAPSQADPVSALEEREAHAGSGRGNYIEALMRFFPRLVVLNGIVFGLDPLLPARASSPQSEGPQREPDSLALPRSGMVAAGGLSPDALAPDYPLRWREGPVRVPSSAARTLGFDVSRTRHARTLSSSSTSSSPRRRGSSPSTSTESLSASFSSSSSHGHRRSSRRRVHHQRRHRRRVKRVEDAAAHVDTSDTIHSVTPEKAETSPNPTETQTLGASPQQPIRSPASSPGVTVIVEPAPEPPLFTPPRQYAASAVNPSSHQGDTVAEHATGTTAEKRMPDRENASTGATQSAAHVGEVASADHSRLSPRPSLSGSCVEVLTPLKKDTSPLSSLKWRPKRVSRGTNTDVSFASAVVVDAAVPDDAHAGTPPVHTSSASASSPATAEAKVTVGDTPVRILERELAHRCEELEHGEVRLQRAREQLSLRVAVEVDLRRQLNLVHQRCLEVEAAKETQAAHLRSQVMALKDELMRRSQEAQLMIRQHRAELDAARAREASRRALEDKLAQQRQVIASLQDQLQRSHHDAQAALARVDNERAEWESNAALWQRQCETAEVQHNEERVHVEQAHQQALRETSANAEARAVAQMALVEAESAQRQIIESAAQTTLLRIVGADVTAAWQAEHARATAALQSHVEARTEERDTLAEHIAVLTAQYHDVLQHAEQEMADLRRALADKPAAPSALCAAPTTACDATQTAYTKESSAAVTPTSPPRAREEEAKSGSRTGPIQDTTAYWRETCRFREAEISRLHEALRISQESYRALSQENSRLLHEAQHELPERHQAESAAWQREKENLLRTVRNLQEDLGKKDENTRDVEAEARAKINAKRERIAELEEENESLHERHAMATQQSVALRDELEVARRRIEELERSALDQGQKTSEGTAALVQALRMAREQLVAVHESHNTLLRDQQSLKDQCARRDAELEECRRAYRMLQDDARTRQKATFDALSRIMAPTGVGDDFSAV